MCHEEIGSVRNVDPKLPGQGEPLAGSHFMTRKKNKLKYLKKKNKQKQMIGKISGDRWGIW